MQPLSFLVFLSCLVAVLSARTPQQIIESFGYPVETYEVQTEDGYLLEMHRIPYGLAEGAGPSSYKPVVYLQHGLMSSSADFIYIGPDRSLGYLLADMGYDVWLGNTRGNTHSRKHVSLDPNKPEFWDFSWHENGFYDLPAMIDHILNKTKQEKLFYIGYSQGTIASYVMATERPEYNNKIRAIFSLAPVAYMGHVKSPLMKFISQFDGVMEILFKLLGIYEFMPAKKFVVKFGGELCTNVSPMPEICTNPFFVITGFTEEQMSSKQLPPYQEHTPAGASTKQILHYSQTIKTVDKFRQYNYGIVKNLFKYKRPTPPNYDIGKITAPVALIYSHNDIFTAEVDLLKLYHELPNPIGRFLVADETFNHWDFISNEDVVALVYNKVFDLMTQY